MNNKTGRRPNVVIFSAGETVERARQCKDILGDNGINANDYTELFSTAKNKEHIALLPSLIKKIPTFDYAIIIAEGVDTITLRRNEKVASMRDNLIFEIGMCIMALGVEKVILLYEEGVRIPEDLIGLDGIGIKNVCFEKKDFDSQMKEIASDINVFFSKAVKTSAEYILRTFNSVSPIIVGAAVASAEAYFSNFILRFLDHYKSGYYTEDNEHFLFEDVSFEIYIPNSIYEETDLKIREYYEKRELKKGIIEDAGTRNIEFRYIKNGSSVTIVDIPTSITASYSMVNKILEIESDDVYDQGNIARFISKEVGIYKVVLEEICIKKEIENCMLSDEDENRKNKKINILKNIKISRMDI